MEQWKNNKKAIEFVLDKHIDLLLKRYNVDKNKVTPIILTDSNDGMSMINADEDEALNNP